LQNPSLKKSNKEISSKIEISKGTLQCPTCVASFNLYHWNSCYHFIYQQDLLIIKKTLQIKEWRRAPRKKPKSSNLYYFIILLKKRLIEIKKD